MARKPNYNYEKRQKEIARKQKQDEKRARRREGIRDDETGAEGGADVSQQPLPEGGAGAQPE